MQKKGVYSKVMKTMFKRRKKMEEIIFPNQIRMFRRVRGKTMKSLADILNLSLSAISKIEKGYRRIDEDQLAKISKYLDCPPEALFVSEKSSQPEVIKAWKREQERRRKINSGSGLKTLGAGLRYLRGQKGLTLQGVAKGAKMTLSVYHRIEMGQREVEEKTFRDIAHALGYSETDLQMKIYELDMSGALDELKQTEGKAGIFTSKGGYNDLPVSRFMLRGADSQEVTVPIYGFPKENGIITVKKDQSVGSVLCPSNLSYDRDMYAIRIKTPVLGPIIPIDSVLVVSPQTKPKKGDIAILQLNEEDVLPVSVIEESPEQISVLNPMRAETFLLTKSEFSKLQRVVLIAFG